MSDDDGNVTELGVRFKAPPSEDGPTLRILHFGGPCNHSFKIGENGRIVHAHFNIREGETEVECGLCGMRLDPMFVLRRMAMDESAWMRTRQAYQDEMKRLNERQRCKCQHCGRMTRIKR